MDYGECLACLHCSNENNNNKRWYFWKAFLICIIDKVSTGLLLKENHTLCHRCEENQLEQSKISKVYTPVRFGTETRGGGGGFKCRRRQGRLSANFGYKRSVVFILRTGPMEEKGQALKNCG